MERENKETRHLTIGMKLYFSDRTTLRKYPQQYIDTMAAPGEGREALLTLEISSITELVSAQQRMRVLAITGVRLSSQNYNVDDLQQHQNYTNGSINGKSSTLSFPIRLCVPTTTDTDIVTVTDTATVA